MADERAALSSMVYIKSKYCYRRSAFNVRFRLTVSLNEGVAYEFSICYFIAYFYSFNFCFACEG